MVLRRLDPLAWMASYPLGPGRLVGLRRHPAGAGVFPRPADGDLPFRLVFLLFGAFILSCGTTHLMEAIIFWWPAYRLAGLIKLATALVSWTTVLALIRVAPQALAMRSPEEL